MPKGRRHCLHFCSYALLPSSLTFGKDLRNAYVNVRPISGITYVDFNITIAIDCPLAVLVHCPSIQLRVQSLPLKVVEA